MRYPLVRPLFSLSILLFFTLYSCQNSKQLTYFKDLSDTSKVYSLDVPVIRPIKLQFDDQIQIIISSSAPEAVQFFNLMSIAQQNVVASSGVSGAPQYPSQSFANTYAVNRSGYITLPVLGDILVMGLTLEQLKELLSYRLKDYLKDVVISARLTNFKVTVIGDVQRPTTIPVQGESINVLEALGIAGDLTVYGKRYNIKVVRRVAERIEVANLNLNSSTVLQSPFFQLQQNDVVYIEPNKNKGLLGEGWNMWIPVITSVLTLFVVTISNLR